MADRRRGPRHPVRKVDLRAMAAIRRLQANPKLGEFRIHEALAQQGIHLSPRTCGRILALHRELGAPQPAPATPPEPQPFLPELEGLDWRSAQRLAPYRARRLRRSEGRQARLVVPEPDAVTG